MNSTLCASRLPSAAANGTSQYRTNILFVCVVCCMGAAFEREIFVANVNWEGHLRHQSVN